MMTERVLNLICREVYRRFPDLRGTRPKVKNYGPGKGSPSNPSPKYLLVFQGEGVTDTDKPLPYAVRVVVNAQGKILKMSMSR